MELGLLGSTARSCGLVSMDDELCRIVGGPKF